MPITPPLSCADARCRFVLTPCVRMTLVLASDSCIFGLTGSVGGEAERQYIEKTYQAVPYEVPQFLKTCDATTKEDATNLGVVIKERFSEKIHEVVQAARQYHTDVPVLIITRGAEKDELPKVVRALLEALTSDPRERMRNRERMRATGEFQKLCRLSQMGMASFAASPPPS